MFISPIGPGGIHPRLLKELADVMLGPLSITYQRFWDSGEGPADWKLANVLPIYKKGVKEHSGSYSPISIPSASRKIMLNIKLGTAERHLKKNTVIRHSQHGFNKGESCLTKMISLCDKVICLGN